jgi:hypothetical protein
MLGLVTDMFWARAAVGPHRHEATVTDTLRHGTGSHAKLMQVANCGVVAAGCAGIGGADGG